MSRSSIARGFVAGVLTANAVPHAYSAVVGNRQMTPLAGRDSGPRTNGVWALANAAAATAVARSIPEADVPTRVAYRAGVALFSVWVLASEKVPGLN